MSNVDVCMFADSRSNSLEYQITSSISPWKSKRNNARLIEIEVVVLGEEEGEVDQAVVEVVQGVVEVDQVDGVEGADQAVEEVEGVHREDNETDFVVVLSRRLLFSRGQGVSRECLRMEDVSTNGQRGEGSGLVVLGKWRRTSSSRARGRGMER